MSTSAAPAASVTPSTIITLKVLYNGGNRRFKIPLRELGARVLPQKLRQLLGVSDGVNVIFERYSDSAGCFVHLDSDNPAVYKQLYRAAKAKLKLRIKATLVDDTAPQSPMPEEQQDQHQHLARYSYLETVLSSPLPEAQTETMPSQSPEPETTETDKSNTAESQPIHSSSMDVDVNEPQPQYRDFVLDQDSLDVPMISHTSPSGVYSIECNRCRQSIANGHYHCSICEEGDYDLCLECVTSGFVCPSGNHWLIRRDVKDGIVTNSTTEKVPPRQVQEEAKVSEPVPELVSDDIPEPLSAAPEIPFSVEERICNGCLKELDETKMVSCVDCDDYDLCITCLLKDAHGHHPAHSFSLLRERQFCLKGMVLSRCKPGRHHQHAAICDGCDKGIVGVRHKCLTCPDWDYCSECLAQAPQHHPGHRFAPLYESISEPSPSYEVHYGIFCDGPLCRNQPPSYNYITGVRYKCSVCYDTDFCAKCEALPTNSHNRTHPMVMFKTPVRNVTVNTLQEHGSDKPAVALGDQAPRSTSTQVTSPVELETSSQGSPIKETQPIVEAIPEEKQEEQVKVEETPASDPASSYQAFFIRDTVPDGTGMVPNKVFQQTWTLYNPGPLAWPAGSDVRFVGGDPMFNVDTNHPLSVDSISAAMESNKLHEPLEAGQSADFTVTLKTPSRVGTAISYWRLKLSNGMPFGHRLWCDISVRDDAPVPIESVAPEPKIKEEKDNQDESPATRNFERSGSQMIFPKLDKESPESSTHEGLTTAPSAPSVSNPSERDILEDVESLTLGEDDDTEAGFLTDEEYDILDASDQEYMDAKSSRT